MTYDYWVGKRGHHHDGTRFTLQEIFLSPADQLPLRRRATRARRAELVGAAEEALDLDLVAATSSCWRWSRTPTTARSTPCRPTGGGHVQPNGGPIGIGLFNYDLSEQSARIRERGQRGDPARSRAARRRAVPEARRDRRASTRRTRSAAAGWPTSTGLRRRRRRLRGVRLRGPLLHGLLGDPDEPRRQPVADDLGGLRARGRAARRRGRTTSACRSARSGSQHRPPGVHRRAARVHPQPRASCRLAATFAPSSGRRRPPSEVPGQHTARGLTQVTADDRPSPRPAASARRAQRAFRRRRVRARAHPPRPARGRSPRRASAGAEQALEQLETIDESLAACQVGITLASIGIGFLGEPALKELLEPIFGGLSHGAPRRSRSILAFLIATSLHITVRRAGAEDARDHPRRAHRRARLVAAAARLRSVISAPFTHRADSGSPSAIVRLFGVDPRRPRREAHDRRTSRRSSAPPPRAARSTRARPVMLGGVFHLHEQEAREVMTPIPAVVTVNADETVEEALRRCVSSGHTRLVVDRGRQPGQGARHRPQQQPRPPLHERRARRVDRARDPRGARSSRRRSRSTTCWPSCSGSAARSGSSPTSTAAPSASSPSRTSSRRSSARSRTRPTPAPATVRRLTDGDWYVRGHVPLGDLEDAGIDLPVDSDAFNSIGGYVFSELGRLPKRGDRIDRRRLRDPRRVGPRQPHRRRPHPPGHDRARHAQPPTRRRIPELAPASVRALGLACPGAGCGASSSPISRSRS